VAKRKKEPKYCRQKSKRGDDRAYVKLGGVRHYVGKYDSPESKEESCSQKTHPASRW